MVLILGLGVDTEQRKIVGKIYSSHQLIVSLHNIWNENFQYLFALVIIATECWYQINYFVVKLESPECSLEDSNR